MIEYINIVSIRQARVENYIFVYMCCQVIGIRFCVESKYLDMSSCSPWLSQSICNLRYCSLQRYNGFPRFRPWSVSPYSSKYGGNIKLPLFKVANNKTSHSRTRKKIPTPQPHV